MFNDFIQDIRLMRSRRGGGWHDHRPDFVASIENLETRMVMSAVPVAAAFHAIDNKQIDSIKVDGINLLQGSGFDIIGSRGTADDLNNVASESPYNSNGIMRPYNGQAQGGSLPYSFKFTKDNGDASKYYFTASVGKSSFNYAVMDIPLSGKTSLFTYFRTSANPTLQRYDEIGNGKPAYNNAGVGNYYIEGAGTNVQWAEMIGPQYTLRLTITNSSAPMSLAFVNVPGLGGGVRDLEYGFVNGLPKNAQRSVSGVIQVFRTDTSLLPATVYQAESNNFHQVGRRDGDGWSVNVKDRPGSFLQYGPYVNVASLEGVAKNSSQLVAGDHTATFRLQIDNNTANNAVILTLDIYDAASGRVVKKLDITRKMFNSAGKYQDFTLNFNAAPGQQLEFRTFWAGGAAVKQDSVTIR
jgi:hypothetical protein